MRGKGLLFHFAICLALAQSFVCARSFACDPSILARVVEDNGFTVHRNLDDYSCMMSGNKNEIVTDHRSVFRRELDSLTPDDLWIDMGAGELYAFQQFLYSFLPPFLPPRLEAVSYVVNRDLPEGFKEAIKLHKARFVEDIPENELGKAKLITDVYGPMTYTAKPDEVLRRYLDRLTDDGSLYLFVGPESDYSRSKVKIGEHEFMLVEWLLEHTKGITVERIESLYNPQAVRPDQRGMFSDLSAHCLTFRVRKNGQKIDVPDLRPIHVREAPPHSPVPYRDYEPGRAPIVASVKLHADHVVPAKEEPPKFSTASFQLLTPRYGDRHALASVFEDERVRAMTGLWVEGSFAETIIQDGRAEQEKGAAWNILNLSVVDKETKRVKGVVQFGRRSIHEITAYRIQPGEKVAQLLFAFDYGDDGTHLKEVVEGSLAYGFGELGLTRIVTRIRPNASQTTKKTLEALGFKPIGGSAEYYEVRKR